MAGAKYNVASNTLLLASLLMLPALSDAFKILMFPYGNKSHILQFHGIGRVLLKRGHEVHIYLSRADTPPKEIASANYKFIHPTTNETLMPYMPSEADMLSRIGQPVIQQLIQHRDANKKSVESIDHIVKLALDDPACMEAIRRENYDFALVDSMIFMRFLLIIPHKMGIQYGALATVPEPLSNRVPFFPSAFADVALTTAFGAQPGMLGESLKHRMLNFLGIAFHALYLRSWFADAFEAANTTMDQVQSQMAFTLVDQHNLLSFPTPTTPNFRMVGGLVARPAEPITDKTLLSFIEDPDHAVIVCSFGTMMSSLNEVLLDKLMSAFRRVPQYKVVIRVKDASIQNVPENVLIMDWLPQNDLLGHNNTALFITHSGNNGQNEALYHGVPMVAFYIFGDQEHNADRVARRGYGVKLHLLTFSADSLAESINEVMTNDTYKRNIGKASRIFREESPGDEAADLIEHVIKFGSDHLRQHEAYSMSIAEFAMLDVVVVVLTVVSLIVSGILIVLWKLLKCVFRRTRK